MRIRHGYSEVHPRRNTLKRYFDPESSQAEDYPIGYLERMHGFAGVLDQAIQPGDRVACFSHAASIALVAALLRTELVPEMKFAPTGVWTLVRRGPPGTPWEVVRQGDTNEPYNHENSDGTFPWGFSSINLDTFATARGTRFPPNAR